MRILSHDRTVLPGAYALTAVALSMVFGMVAGIRAQTPLLHPADGKTPSFEVASIRPSGSVGGFVNYHISSERFGAENATLSALIRLAYDIRSDDQLPSEPKWIESEKFDIDAKLEDSEVTTIEALPPEKKIDRYRLMVQSLLAERFKLKLSERTKDVPIYALLVAKNGPKLTALPETADSNRRLPMLSGGSRGEMKAGAVSMDFFASWISGTPEAGERVVEDETGLKGRYDFTLNWTKENRQDAQFNGASTGPGESKPASAGSAGPSFLTALQEQLGLKLVSRRAAVEVLIIDHVEHPSPN
jgi:uncharacterized protein (TIGR03435 family)